MADSSTEASGSGDTRSAEDARKNWADLLSTVQYGDKHVTITRSGKPAAILVPVAWHSRAEAALAAQDKPPRKRA